MLMRLDEHLGMGRPGRGLEAIGGKFDQQAQRVLEVNRIHEAPVLDAAVGNAAFL
jgi:hypothetical protein